MLVAGAAGAVVFIAISYWIAHPYLYIADNFPAAKRSPHEVAAFSGPLKALLTAPDGVLQVFGLYRGTPLHPLGDAIRAARSIWVRHEEGAALAAAGQAKLTGGLGVCAGTTGSWQHPSGGGNLDEASRDHARSGAVG